MGRFTYEGHIGVEGTGLLRLGVHYFNHTISKHSGRYVLVWKVLDC
jgi:hypothetical protein